MNGIIFVLISVLFNVSGQLSIKTGMNKIGTVEINSTIFTAFSKILIHPNILIGLAFYVVSAFSWIIALSKLELSVAYPLLSIGYVILMFVSYFFLNESLGINKIIGTLLIVSGLIFISR